jgi:hypothetical protein
LLLEILEAEPDSLGDGIALPIAAIQALVLAIACQVDRDDEFDGFGRETRANSVGCCLDFNSTVLIARRGKQTGCIFGIQTLSPVSPPKDLLRLPERLRDCRQAFEAALRACKKLTEPCQFP